MTIGTMFTDIVQSFFTKHDTQLYPAERIAPPERYRGSLFYNPSLCTGCSLCVKDCPSNAIELVILDREAKKYVMKYHMDRCIYCGQCVVNCKPKCLGMSNEDWEHAALDKNFMVYYGKDKDIATYLENIAQPAVEPTGS
ncbi:MAG TPA: 4Fe-4S binding protein [Anaerolineales bacterium]|nr:4Fe-4S binding protein [Anaerolineales bacterium]